MFVLTPSEARMMKVGQSVLQAAPEVSWRGYSWFSVLVPEHEVGLTGGAAFRSRDALPDLQLEDLDILRCLCDLSPPSHV